MQISWPPMFNIILHMGNNSTEIILLRTFPSPLSLTCLVILIVPVLAPVFDLHLANAAIHMPIDHVYHRTDLHFIALHLTDLLTMSSPHTRGNAKTQKFPRFLSSVSPPQLVHCANHHHPNQMPQQWCPSLTGLSDFVASNSTSEFIPTIHTALDKFTYLQLLSYHSLHSHLGLTLLNITTFPSRILCSCSIGGVVYDQFHAAIRLTAVISGIYVLISVAYPLLTFCIVCAYGLVQIMYTKPHIWGCISPISPPILKSEFMLPIVQNVVLGLEVFHENIDSSSPPF